MTAKREIEVFSAGRSGGKGFEASEHIRRTVDEVWNRLTDWPRAPAWMNGIEEFNGPERDAVTEGSTLVFRARGAERETTVAEWSPPRRMVLRSRQGGVTAMYEYRCEPEGDGARVTLRARCETRGFLWGLAGPIIRYLMKCSDSGQIAALKGVLESP